MEFIHRQPEARGGSGDHTDLPERGARPQGAPGQAGLLSPRPGVSLAPVVPHRAWLLSCPASGPSSSGTSKNHTDLIGSQFTANKEKAGDIYLAE